MNPILLFGGFAVVVILLVLVLSGSGSSTPAHKRLKVFTDLDREAQHKGTFYSSRATGGTQTASWVGGASAKKKVKAESVFVSGGSLKQQLLLVGAVMLGAGAIMLMVARGFLPKQAASFLLPAVVGAILVPRVIYIARIKKMRKKFAENFPAAIRMMTNSLKAGQDIRSAFEMVAEDMPSPMREEFAQILNELNVGVSLEAALKNFESRMKMGDVKVFVVGVLLNNKLGGNLTEVLQKLETAMRDRIRLRKEIKSLTAQAQASASLLAIMVPGVSGYMFVSNPDYMAPLIRTDIGLWILIGSYLAAAFGTFVLFKMASVSFE